MLILCVFAGKHVWMAFSNGEDTYKHKYEAVKLLNYDVTRVPGSNETYCFRGTGTADGTTATLLHKFMQCYCSACRSKQYSQCPSLDEFGCFHSIVVQKKVAANSGRRTRSMEADIACSGCTSTGDHG